MAKNNYFYGWYLKAQSKEHTLATIFAYHIKNGVPSYSVQVITEQGTWTTKYAPEECALHKETFAMKVGDNSFNKDGLTLSICENCNIRGSLKFGPFTQLKGDIMGPFAPLPMECSHMAKSMRHTVSGDIAINGTVYHFDHDAGYIEGDKGSSFPKEYLWTHCCEGNISLMLSVAQIPFGPFHFRGIICFIYDGQTERRIATYRFAKLKRLQNKSVTVKQGKYTLTARLMDDLGTLLKAPVAGDMSRLIRENIRCKAQYTLTERNKTVFSFTSEKASFEYEFQS